MSVVSSIYRHRWTGAELEPVRAVWVVLVRDFFQALIPDGAAILDVGCGFCHFINNVRGAERVGVDANPEARAFAGDGVRFIQSSDLTLSEIPDDHFDVVFLSNFLEHLRSGDDVLSLLSRIRELLKTGGRVIILQPNFRLLGAAYFDFIDHKTILTDSSMREALEVAGFAIDKTIVRFLPYTTKSRMPSSPTLVRLYLRMPFAWRLFGKQSLFVARKTN